MDLMARRAVARLFVAFIAGLTIAQGGALEAVAGDPTATGSGAARGPVAVTFDPMSLPSNGKTNERARQNAARVAAARERHGGGRSGGRTTDPQVIRADQLIGQGPATGASGSHAGAAVDAVASGISLLHVEPQLNSFDLTAAIVGDVAMYAGHDRLIAWPHPPTGLSIQNWDPAEFFGLPNGDWYFGPSISSSIYRGRFIAALPSYVGPDGDCTTGYMNVAVSTSSDPTKPWRRYRLSIGDAWTDQIQIGVSDTKVVLSTNRWDLSAGKSDCLGAPYEGARLRVMDWEDLLDGGTLTTKDVSPAPYTSYYNWVAATNVAPTSSTTTGSTLYLAGDKLVGTWGSFMFATITGGVKAGTAKVARNENLTASGAVTQLGAPPESIAAFGGGGNGFQDERIESVTYRGSRLWAASTGACLVEGDSAARACARFINLSTSTTPATNLESAYLAELERDTFVPIVGFSRDGGAYFSVAASSAIAHEPIDQLATYRASGQPLVGGASEVPIWLADAAFEDTYWGHTGSLVAVPGDHRAVLDVYAGIEGGEFGVATQLRGGQTGDPGGTIVRLGNGSGWARDSITTATVRPLATSPINLMRYSASPDVESTAGGSRLVHGVDAPPGDSIAPLDLADSILGAGADQSAYSLYVQWQTWDGTWSAPISSTLQIDTVKPLASTPTMAFTTGTIGTSVPIKWSWTASDAESGLGTITYQEDRGEPTPAFFGNGLPGSATTYTRSMRLDSSYFYSVNLEVVDRAFNTTLTSFANVTFASVPSSVNMTFVKTWSTGTNTKYLGGKTRYATAAGATVTYSCTCRALAFISTKGPNRGKAEIWIDGVKKATVDLMSSTTKYRQLAYQTSWATDGSHTIMVKVLGTSGRPRVDFDSFLKAYNPFP